MSSASRQTRLFSGEQPVLGREGVNPSQGQHVSVVESEGQASLPGAKADVAAGDERLHLRKIVDLIAANADSELHPVEAAIIFMVTLIEVEDPVSPIPFVEDVQIGSLAGPDPVSAFAAK